MRLELSLKIDYVPHWDVSSGIREFVSNARDAEIEFRAPMKIDWYQNLKSSDAAVRTGVLRIENTGTTLPREALLFGYTTKLGNSEMIGSFAEGLKLSTLVLLRNGHPVTIRSGGETWEPAIERSDKFDAQVLVFHIADGRKEENRVRVEIGNITKDMWDGLQKNFLFLNKEDEMLQVRTSYGSLLLNPKYSGMIFVKGIFVQQTASQFGYDLTQAELDRDRKMVDSYNRQDHQNQIWNRALVTRPDLMEIYFLLFDKQKEDIEGIQSWNTYQLPKEFVKYASEQFFARYGASAVPVGTVEESKDIEHYGKQGVVVTKQLGALLKSSIGDFETIKKALRNETKRSYSWSEFDPDQKDCFEAGCALIQQALGLPDTDPGYVSVMGLVDIVEFGSPDLEGLYRDGRVQVRVDFLNQPDKFLQVLIHETAHHISAGADGDKSHVASIENLWMKVWSTSRKK